MCNQDIVRVAILIQEIGVFVLYVFAGVRFWRCRHILGERAEGRPAGIFGLLCLLGLSIRSEFATWGQPLTIIEPLQLVATICLFWLWWKVLGVVRWRQRRNRPIRDPARDLSLT